MAAVAAGEETAGEAVEEMTETETMVAEGSIAEVLDTPDRHDDVTLERENHTEALLQENWTPMFPVAVEGAEEMNAGDLPRLSLHLLHPYGHILNHGHLPAVEIDLVRILVRQNLDDADQALQIDTGLHIEDEEAVDEAEPRIAWPVEDHRALHLFVHVLVLYEHLNAEDLLHRHL